MKALIETRSIDETFQAPPARIVFVSNDTLEVNNPLPPQQEQPIQQEEELEPEPEPKQPEPVEPEQQESPPPEPVAEPLPEIVEEKTVEVAKVLEPVKPKVNKKPKNRKKPKKRKTQRKTKSRQTARAKFDSRPLYRPKPHYPNSARRGKIEGYVLVKYTVLKSGRVSNVGIITASPRGVFESSALSAVRRWRFKPQPGDRPGLRSRIRFQLR